MSDNGDYMKVYNEFWKGLVTDEQGNLDLDKVARELYDYHIVMGEVGEVYEHVTGGRLSKPNTAAHHVTSYADEYYAKIHAADQS